MEKNILVRIEEEFGYQYWWALYTPGQFEDIKRRWQTMKGLNCLVPVDLIFPGARGCFGEWPPEALCIMEFANTVEVGAHVHQHDDSYVDNLPYDIPETVNGVDDGSFEIDGVVYSDADIQTLLAESRKRRDDEFFTAHPEYAPTAARAEPETGE